ncbi:MAG: branched-chain amino acid transport system ATP-binding protein, partial [Gaiellales bacterium]|nr:branched-chain amino acid transport system ATP-binding protein [Gaiellales bacterium]
MSDAMLELAGLDVSYGSVAAVRNLSLEVGRGEIVGLIGPNGAGKSTTLHAIMGMVPAHSGEIRLAGASVRGKPPEVVARTGIALVPEGRQIFPNLTVRENLVAFAANRSGGKDPWTVERIFSLFPNLKSREENFGSQLSGGEQQMLAIGRALVTNPHL